MTPKMSIIIPVYNVEKYLRQCLDSAMNQTLREIEIICINDGSTDSSGAILDEYAAQDSRLIVLRQENQGLGIARNNTLKQVRGKYIAFLDSDDWLELTFCEKLYRKAQGSQADVITCFPHVLGNSYKRHLSLKNFSFADRFSLEERLEVMDVAIEVWNHLWKTEMVRRYSIQFSSLRSTEDLLFTICGLIFAEKVSVLNERLYYWEESAGKKDSCFLEMPQVFMEITEKLKEEKVTGWEEPLFFKKWRYFYEAYKLHFLSAKKEIREKYLDNVRKSCSSEDRDFWHRHDATFSKEIQQFYHYNVLQLERTRWELWSLRIKIYLRNASWNCRLKKILRQIKTSLRLGGHK